MGKMLFVPDLGVKAGEEVFRNLMNKILPYSINIACVATLATIALAFAQWMFR